jgi:putative signal transducing protein
VYDWAAGKQQRPVGSLPSWPGIRKPATENRLFVSAYCRTPPRNSCCQARDLDAQVLALEELIRTNDLVLISYVEALLRDAGIAAFVADQNMSIIEGSLGVLPRRVMVPDDELDAARKLLRDAGMAKEISAPKGER